MSKHVVISRGHMSLNRLVARKNWSRILCLVAFCILPSAIPAQVPVYEVRPVESTIKFGVDSSVPIRGTFDKWNARMKFSSTDVRSGVLIIEIQADSVNTGSGLKNNKLKSKDFFDVKESPVIALNREGRSDRSKHLRVRRRFHDSRRHEDREAHSHG
jgi:polyisoprenoid-binding protein YceI